jgi:hypothetical protein
VLAYVFWHRPRERAEAAEYEDALIAFQRSLARNRPVGNLGAAVYRVASIPWLADGGSASSEGGYEDWYLLEDFAALGVLGEAAVGRGHRTSHDGAAARMGAGAAGLYALAEGRPGADSLAAALRGVWVDRPTGGRQPEPVELLGDGLTPGRSSLWRRALALGPAPELCVLADEEPSGVAAARLPAGWRAQTIGREAIWHG